MDFQKLDDNVDALVKTWMPDRAERMARKALERADFEALARAGLTLTGVPTDLGGLWQGPAQSARPVAMLLRKLAGVDPSLALVASMHPAVLSYWLTAPIAAGSGALRAGEIAFLLTAGGQGTRLGFDQAKGLYPIGPVSGRTLFQIMLDLARARGRRYGVSIDPSSVVISNGVHPSLIAALRTFSPKGSFLKTIGVTVHQ